MIKLTDIAIINPENIGNITEINYIDIASVGSGKIIEIKNLTENFPSRAKRKIIKGDIIISTVRPNLRTYAIVDFDLDNLVCSTGFVVIRPKNTEYKDILYHIVTSNEAFRFYEKNCEGGNYPAFKSSIFNNFEINEIKSIDKSLNILRKQNTLIKQSKLLIEKIDTRNNYYTDNLLNGNISLNEIGISNISLLTKSILMDKIVVDLPKSKLDAKVGKNKGEYRFFKSSAETYWADDFIYDIEAIVMADGGKANVEYYNGKFSTSNHVYVFNSPVLNNKYFYYLLKSKIHLIDNCFQGAALKNLSKKQFKQLELNIFEDVDYQTKIANFLDNLNDEKSKVEKLLKLEEQRFEWLSDKLLSGEYIIED